MKQTKDVAVRAMLVNVAISCWEARKNDRAVTDKVNAEYAADQEAGRYHKHLFGGKTAELQAVMAAYHRLRDAHNFETLPWSNDGWRILPTSNYFPYVTAVQKAKAAFETAVEAFVAAYPRLREEAKARLNGMYREADYPSAAVVRQKFYVDVQYSTIPLGEDLHVDLPKAELARVAKDLNGRVNTTVAAAMQSAWERLGDVVTAFRDRIEEDGKGLRETAVTKLGAVADVLGRLNLTGDAQLEKVRIKVQNELATLDVTAIRKDDAARFQAQKAADDILKAMTGAYAPAGKEGK
jgi:hypothetical protein